MIYVLVPGAWAGGWIWDAVAAKLRELGHSVHQLTLPGLETDAYPGQVRLSTHVDAVVHYLESRDLNNVILVGHSYSGIVVGQVSTRLQPRISHSVFVEAFLPVDGMSLLDVSGLDVAQERQLIDENGGLWPAPTLEELEAQPRLSKELIKLLASKQKDHPGRTITDQARLPRPLTRLRATFISEEGWLKASREAELVETLRNHDNWEFTVTEGGHWPMLTMPDELSAILNGIRAESDTGGR